MDHAELRALVARVQQQVELVSKRGAGDAAPADELSRAWQALVQHLALGPAPETRDCPRCHKTIMRAATLCGHCWTKLGDSPQH